VRCVASLVAYIVLAAACHAGRPPNGAGGKNRWLSPGRGGDASPPLAPIPTAWFTRLLGRGPVLPDYASNREPASRRMGARSSPFPTERSDASLGPRRLEDIPCLVSVLIGLDRAAPDSGCQLGIMDGPPVALDKAPDLFAFYEHVEPSSGVTYA